MIDSMSDSARPWELSCQCALILSDIHQRTNWADAVLAHEKGVYDHVVFLGDIMDSFHNPPEVTGARETGKWYAAFIERPDTTVLLGNHDCSYAEAHGHPLGRRKRSLLHPCSGFTNSKAIEFSKELSREHWKKVTLFRLVNGWLLSHAGIRENFWHSNLTQTENLANLWIESAKALDSLATRKHPLLGCGYGRGGDQDWGGLTWCDWDTEFQDNLPYPQIVGHSHSFDLHRKIGRSWCIDSGVGYALLRADGSLEHKKLKREKVVGPDGKYASGEYQWNPGVPEMRNDY